MVADNLKTTYMHKNPLVRWFFRTKTNIAIRLADLKKTETILDFGCGAGWLKKKLKKKGYNVVGYDITPKYSDVKDYTKIKANKIFALDVFEHIRKREIKEILMNFKKINPNFELIVAIPTENWVSRKCRKLLGKSEKVSDHITSFKEILKILNSQLKLIRKINFLSVSYIAKFKHV